jgi:hypothetical protein
LDAKSIAEGLENIEFGQKISTCKVEAKESMAAEEIRAIKKKPSTLHQDDRKDTFRAF